MRVLGATFHTVEEAEAARAELERTLALTPGTFRQAVLGDRGQADDGQPLLAGHVADAAAQRAFEIMQHYGGRLVADLLDRQDPVTSWDA